MDMPAAEFEVNDLIIKDLIVKRGSGKRAAQRILWCLSSAVASGILAALSCGVALLLAGF
jgi:hypothetical protein